MLIVENIVEYRLKQSFTFQRHHLNILLYVFPKFPLCDLYVYINMYIQYITLCNILHMLK